MFRVNNARTRFLDEEEEYRLVLAECNEHLHDLVVTALHTGFRRNELFSLRSEDVDFARGLVSVRAGYAKNGEGRSVPMSGTCLRGTCLGGREKEAEKPSVPRICSVTVMDAKNSRALPSPAGLRLRCNRKSWSEGFPVSRSKTHLRLSAGHGGG